MVPLPRPRRHRHHDRLRALGGARCRGGHTPVLHGADGSVGNSVRASPRWSGWPPETARGRGDASRTGRGVNAARPIPPLRAVEQQGLSYRAGGLFGMHPHGTCDTGGDAGSHATALTPAPRGGRRGLTRRPPLPRLSPRHAFVPRVSRSSDRAGVGRRVRVTTSHRAARRRPRRPVGRSPPFRPVASSPGPGLAAGRRERPRRAVAHAALPRGGVLPDGVRHLRVLLAGAGRLWGDLPRGRATSPRAAGVRQASAQPGRPARSLRPPTGLPREMSPPRDSCPFPPPPAIQDHRTTRQARGYPARVPRVWARVGACGRVWARQAAWRGPPARSGGAQRRKAPDHGDS